MTQEETRDQRPEKRDSSTAQADTFAGANAEEKASASSARNDKLGWSLGVTGDWIERNDEWFGCGDSGVCRPGDQQAQRIRYDTKFHGQAGQRFTIDLGVDWFGVNGFAHQAVGLPKIDVLFFS